MDVFLFNFLDTQSTQWEDPRLQTVAKQKSEVNLFYLNPSNPPWQYNVFVIIG